MKPVDPRMLPHLRPARAALAAVVAGSVAGGLLVIAQAFAVAGLLTAVLQHRPAAPWALALGGVAAGRALASWLTDAAAAHAAGRVGTGLRRRVVDAALALGPAALSRRRTGELTLLTTRGVAAVEPYLTRYLPALLVAAVLPAATVAAIATQDLTAAVVVVGTLPLVPVFAILVGLATRDRADRQWRVLSALSGHFVDVVRGLPTLVAYNRATAQGGRIRAVTDRYRRATQETLRLAFASSAVLELVATISVALVAVVVGLRLAAGSLDLGTALVVLLLAPEAYWPLRRVGAEFHAAAEGTATFAAVDALLDEAAAAEPVTLSSRPGPGIDVVDVTVRYPDRTEPALAGFSARLEPVGLTAVVGPSGAGKSTLLAALTGQLPVASGEIRLGHAYGADLASWQEHVAWLPQRPLLLAASVRDNVRLGRPDATDADVWRALERVRLAHHVATLPDGLDAVLGEDGAGFSAGEKARLSLARVVVADRPWVLLDEPTAHLDAETESVIADTLLELAASRAVVVVAHRPALAELADHVVEVPAPRPATSEPADAGWSRSARSERLETTRPAGGYRDASPAEPAAGRPPRTGLRLALGTALGALAAASGIALTATAGWLIVRASAHPPVLLLMVAIVGVRTFGLARPALRYAERLVSHDAALRLLAERRARVYDALVPLVPGRLGRLGPRRGDVLASVVDDVDSVVDRLLRVRGPVWTAVTVGAMSVVLAGWVAPTAGLVVAVVALAGGVPAYLAGRAGARAAERRFVAARARLSDRVTGLLQAAPDLVMWQAASRAVEEVEETSADLASAARRSARGAAAGRAAALLAAGLGVVAVTAVTSGPWSSGAVSGPMLALLALLPLALADVLVPLADAGALSVRTRAAADRLAALEALTPAVADPGVPTPLHGGLVSLDGVDAGWEGANVLRGVSLDLPAGARLGVVGPSGCGKSTLAALLLRFLDPSRGAVRMDGTDLRAAALSDVRGQVGLVDDDPHVFSSTLLENVRLAQPRATTAEVERALRRAHLGGWLDGLPDGLDTVLGDGHAAVSGGERARLALARALLADRPVLVLDEPTAHLDTGTAAAVADALLGLRDRTLVWITHGRAGLNRMDDVLRLEPNSGLSPEIAPHA